MPVPTKRPETPWALEPSEITDALAVEPHTGLSSAEAAERIQFFGANLLRKASRRPWWAIIGAQFSDMVVWLLAGGALLSFVFGEVEEGWAIVAVLVINGIIGFVTELRASRSMEALRTLANTSATVRRAKTVQTIPSHDLVPGDVVLLNAGDVVAADIRLLSVSRLTTDESALTGESLPVAKSTEAQATDTPVADRRGMTFKGTFVTKGIGEGIVVATGADSEIGRIAELVATSRHTSTPLEKRLAVLGRRLAWLSLAIAGALVAVGYQTGQDTLLIIETGISLAVATVPEGLPLVATIALARGVWRMAKRKALIRRLSAVETLGSTRVILTDKTGTLTANHLEAASLSLAEGDVALGEQVDGRTATPPAFREALMVAVLCNDTASDTDQGPVGDPLERALLEAGAHHGMTRRGLLASYPEIRHEAFSAEVRMMATFHRDRESVLVAVKGAPEAVLTACTRVREGATTAGLDDERRGQWERRNDDLAEQGFRVLALATKTTGPSDDAPYRDLTLLGLVALIDPPRAGVRTAVHRCRDAGLRVVMLTGDHPGTARNIAAAAGLLDENEGTLIASGVDIQASVQGNRAARERLLAATVIARASPEQKLAVLRLHQEAGNVVAMLGDGVNDAPALRSADIGVAMGRRGTQVARETADMVLEDDDLGTIATAIEQGRIIFRNIRKFARYLLSCNASEVLVITVAMLATGRLPLLPLQILFLNLVTDVFPALALAACEGAGNVMKDPPRSASEPILSRRHWWSVGANAILMGAVVLVGWWLVGASTADEGTAVSAAFFVLAIAQIGHVFNMTEPGSHPFDNEVTRNPWVWGAVALCALLLTLSREIPVLARALDLVALSPEQWALVIGLALVPAVLGRSLAFWGHLRRKSKARAR